MCTDMQSGMLCGPVDVMGHGDARVDRPACRHAESTKKWTGGATSMIDHILNNEVEIQAQIAHAVKDMHDFDIKHKPSPGPPGPPGYPGEKGTPGNKGHCSYVPMTYILISYL